MQGFPLVLLFFLNSGLNGCSGFCDEYEDEDDCFGYSAPLIREPHDKEAANAEKASTESFSFTALLVISGNPVKYCHGSAVNEHFVLTAASCLRGQIEKVIIRVSNRLYSPENTYKVKSKIVHPSYDARVPFLHDIGIVELASPIALKKQLTPLFLPKVKSQLKTASLLSVVGYAFDQSGQPMEDLYTAKMKILSEAECKKDHKNYDHNSMFCLKHQTRKVNVITENDLGISAFRTEFGFVAYGIAANLTSKEPTSSSVFTRTVNHVSWIRQNTKVGLLKKIFCCRKFA